MIKLRFATTISPLHKIKGCFIFLKQPLVRMKLCLVKMKQPFVKTLQDKRKSELRNVGRIRAFIRTEGSRTASKRRNKRTS
ncbi:MAG: hypothetical protein LBL74_02330 [Bacteroidales bacterium]|nr:hypothetical protein [Bacteroidales bacterium]